MNDFINRLLEKIDVCISRNIFSDEEQSNVELKDLSTGSDWNSLKETVCAYLNTDGGYIICGIRERDKKYNLTGFLRKNETNLIELTHKVFQNDNDMFPDLTDFVKFDYLSFRNKDVALITVKSLSEDIKFLKFKNVYYQRKLTSDTKISEGRLQQQREYKLELEYSKELTPVLGATLKDLSLDKINQFITRLNQTSWKLNLIPNIKSAKSFLEKRHFFVNDKVTTLGLLVCGEVPFQFLEYRSEVDCIFDTSNSISKDKRDFQTDVLNLMDEAFRFIWGHIRTGRVVEDGGKMVTEYPEELVREVINNALAHRDYTINKFVTVKVEPNKWLQINNPGSFKARLKLLNTTTDIPIRRIISGMPESKNPKLASILKLFDKIESQGRGMASLVNATLSNSIDLPYYDLADEVSISLTIPSGKLLDDQTERWLSSFEEYINQKLKDTITTEQKIILAYFQKSELLNSRKFYTILLTESNNHYNAIEQLKTAKLIYEHASSTESASIFVLDRVLMKIDFKDDLIQFLGNDFLNFDSIVKQILNIIYRHTRYNLKGIKPASITPEIYFIEFGKIIEPRTYETLGRKIRAICRNLEKHGILIRDLKGNYFLNLTKGISKSDLSDLLN